MSAVLAMVYFFVVVLSATRRRLPFGQILVVTLNHATSNVYSPKAVETLIRAKT